MGFSKPKTSLKGGDYRATQNSDGTWNLHDVPIFVEHKIPLVDHTGEVVTDEGGEPAYYQVGKDWMVRALQRAMERATGFGGKEKPYLPPLHIEHSGDPNKRPAGKYKLRSVKRGSYEGKPRWMLRGDLVHIPEEVYEDIRSGALPYLSAEVLDITTPEIDSVALMDDTVPFFRLPMLIPGEEHAYQGDEVDHSYMARPKRGPVLAYRAEGNKRAVLMDWPGCETETEDTEMKVDDTELQNLADYMARAFKRYMEGMGEDEKKEPPVEEKEMYQDDDEIVDEDPIAIDPDADLDDAPAPVEMDPEPESEEYMDEEEKEKEYECGDDEDEDKKGAMMRAKKDGAVVAKYAAIAAENRKLHKRIAAIENRHKVEQRIKGALAELRRYGLDSEVRDKVKTYAAQGQKVLDVYVEAIKSHRTPEPPEHWDEMPPEAAHVEPEIRHYADNPDNFKRARSYAAEYDQIKRLNPRMTSSKEDYIATQMMAEGNGGGLKHPAFHQQKEN